LPFYYLLNSVIFFRLFFLFKDKPLSKGKVFLLIILQIIPFILIELKLELLFLAFSFIAINYTSYYFEKYKKRNLIRFLTFILQLVSISFFTSSFIGLNFNNAALDVLKNLSGYLFTSPFTGMNWLKLNVILMGILLLINEVNFFIRYFFEVFDVIPKRANSEQTLDEKEYNAGRVIGMLERILIFFFVMISQYAAIGFIIAAKGFTRFKELDQREFAEYVLIGTLLSSLTAIFIAILVKEFLLRF